jgi:hypothetical protein
VELDRERPWLACRKETVISERFASGTLLLQTTCGRFVRLNATGSRLWESLEAPIGLTELVSVLTLEHGLDEQRASADVLAFVQSLADRGLIELTQPARPQPPP